MTYDTELMILGRSNAEYRNLVKQVKKSCS